MGRKKKSQHGDPSGSDPHHNASMTKAKFDQNNRKRRVTRAEAATAALAKIEMPKTIKITPDATPDNTPKTILMRVQTPPNTPPQATVASFQDCVDEAVTAFEARSIIESLEAIMLQAWNHGTRLSQYEGQDAACALLERDDTPHMIRARALLLFAKSCANDEHCTSWYAQAAYTTANDAWLMALVEGEASGWSHACVEHARKLLDERVVIQDAAGDVLDKYFNRHLGDAGDEGDERSEGSSRVGSDESSNVSPTTDDTDPSSVGQSGSFGSPWSDRSV